MQIKEGREQEHKEYQENNQDFYGKGVVDFSERWAQLMEEQIALGKNVIDIAKQTSLDAAEGITGFMYGCAVQELSYFWVHGETLRKWHNLDTQVGTEGERANAGGGVLNPALLSINSS